MRSKLLLKHIIMESYTDDSFVNAAGETDATGPFHAVEKFIQLYLDGMQNEEVKSALVNAAGPEWRVLLWKVTPNYYSGFVYGYHGRPAAFRRNMNRFYATWIVPVTF